MRLRLRLPFAWELGEVGGDGRCCDSSFVWLATWGISMLKVVGKSRFSHPSDFKEYGFLFLG